ncbi:MAG: hypothetical protein NT049_01365 [Planctomycetota bacterium]|nr:hypothetical protein [Planctomycetota bacterium]
MLAVAAPFPEVPRKRSLLPALRRLAELMQHINFGRITFSVRLGQPDFTRLFRTVRTVKPAGGWNGPRPETHSADFEVRKEVMTLFEQVARAVDGAQVTVEVKYGLPFLIEIAEEHQA